MSAMKFCSKCSTQVDPQATTCPSCGANLGNAAAGSPRWDLGPSGGPRSKITAGILGVVLGGFGVHRFYLGYTKIGIIQIVVTVFTCGLGGLWGFIEGILILTGGINRDAFGNPLTD